MKIDFICASLIDFLKENHFNERTIFNYYGVIRRFKQFCAKQQTDEYTTELGQSYANDVISFKTGKFSSQRYFSQGRFFRLIDSFYKTGAFNLSIKKKGRKHPSNLVLNTEYEKCMEYLSLKYSNQKTFDGFLSGIYYFFQYLDSIKFYNLEKITAQIIFDYLKSMKPYQQKDRLYGLRSYLLYKKREDLLLSINGLHVQKRQRIIPMLTEEERKAVIGLINEEKLTARDSAILLLGLHTGIRACDLIRLKIIDIDWETETISFIQSKTGNPITLPLVTDIGNAIARYIQNERPKIKSQYLFLSSLAPYKPFADHSACYEVIRKAFKKAGIDKGNRIFGMHMLRHNAASTMVKNEIPLATIAAILGHSSPESTGIYITTDDERLRKCVLPMSLILKEV